MFISEDTLHKVRQNNYMFGWKYKKVNRLYRSTEAASSLPIKFHECR